MNSPSGTSPFPPTVARGFRDVGAPPDDPESPLRRPLYHQFFGFREAPFDLTPNPRYLFLTSRQREALSNLRYGLGTYKGFTLLIGEAGTGKTTLIRSVLQDLRDTPNRYVLLANPTLTRAEFFEHLAREFGLSEHARRSKSRFLAELQLEVESRYSVGGVTGLIIDEAQSLPYELLEEVRLLGNIETSTSKLLNIVLAGQPELADRLNDPGLRQLKQRVALRCELRPLTLDETAAYISGRIRIAGGVPQNIFTREAVIAIHEASAGIPRTINVLCDNALIGGFAAQVRPINIDTVREVCRDFDVGDSLDAPSTPQSPTEADAGKAAAPREPRLPRPAAGQDRPMFGSVGSVRKRRFIFFSLLFWLSLANGLAPEAATTNSLVADASAAEATWALADSVGEG